MSTPAKFLTPSVKKLQRQKTTLSETDENNKLQVFCRIRPLENKSSINSIKLLSADQLMVESKNQRRETIYKFKHIFTSYSSQTEIFNHIALPLLEDLLQGKNGLLFTYGVTGSGKTHTTTGEQNNPGIIPKCLYTIFNTINEYQTPKCVIKLDKMNGFEIQSEKDALQDRIKSGKNGEQYSGKSQKKNNEKITYINDGLQVQKFNTTNRYAVFLSYVEIYNNSVFDLLDEPNGTKSLENKILREDSRRNMYVNGVIEIEVKSPEEAFDVFIAGQNRKKMASTCLNNDSSRSHSVFNIRIVYLEQFAVNSHGERMIPDENSLKIGQLSIVDLAGSERTNRTNNTGARLKEASSINNSLLTLRTCLEILRENQQNKGSNNRLVPYRDSRLTFLFKPFFEGLGSVRMIVCINPSLDDLEENLHVLKFAEMSQDIKLIKSVINSTPFKKTPFKAKELRTPLRSTKKPKPESFSSHLPSIKLNLDNLQECEASIDKFILAFKLNSQEVEKLDRDIEKKHDAVRQRLDGINQENVLNKTEILNLNAVVQKEKQKTMNFQSKIRDLEFNRAEMKKKNKDMEDKIVSLNSVINDKDLKINQKYLEKEKTKQKLALASERMTHELDTKLRRQRDHLNANIRAKDLKLQMVKDFLNNEKWSPDLPVDNFDIGNYDPSPASSTSVQTHPEQHYSRPSRRNVPPHMKKSRRSKSAGAGDRWLEHNVVTPCPLATVMQPSMKKRKSVNRLDRAEDVTNSKQSKYCLVTQEEATDGEMETKLYKADIIPTCGGGAQVVFNDVEKLRQESPTSGK